MEALRGAAIASSNDEEKALEGLLPSQEAVAICTDIQSLLKAAQSGSAVTSDLRHMLGHRAGKTTQAITG